MRSRCGALTLRVAFAVLALGLASEGAQAAEPSTEPRGLPISLELDGCQALDQGELDKLLAMEFRTLGVLPTLPPERVRVDCAAQRAIVTLESANASNEVDFTATAPSAWPRLLALAVSEIVIESRARGAAPSAPKTTSRPLAKGPHAPTHTSQKRQIFRVFAGATVRRALRPATWLTGPELGVAVELNRYFSLAADLRLELGRTETALARVDWVSTSGALVALAGGNMGRWSFGVGPGMRVGYLRLSPQVQVANATGHAVSGVWGGPEMQARARFVLSARGFVFGGVDSGFITTPVIGLVDGERRLVDTSGVWLSATLGAGLLF